MLHHNNPLTLIRHTHRFKIGIPYKYVLALLATLFFVKASYAHNLNLGALTLQTKSDTPALISLVFQMSDDQGRHLVSRVSVPAGCIEKYHNVELFSITQMRYRQDIYCANLSLEEVSFHFEKLPPGARMMINVQIDGEPLGEQVLPPDQDHWQFSGKGKPPTPTIIVKDYINLGFTHILVGWDHLLFIWMLVLLAPNLRHLIWIITAFTIGHSLTLGLAALSIIKLPVIPTEALIALSIVFMAAEILRHHSTGVRTLTLKHPGLISIGFGLFHGLGFSSVLQDLRTETGPLLWQLIGFNIGVELGQLVFVAILLILSYASKPITEYLKYQLREADYRLKIRVSSNQIFASLCGSMAAFWFIERIASF